MKALLYVLFFAGASFLLVRSPKKMTVSLPLPEDPELYYDMSGVTGLGSPGADLYFKGLTDDARVSRGVADFNGDSLDAPKNGKGWRVVKNLQQEYNLDSFKFYDPSGSRDTIWIWTWDKNTPPPVDYINNPENHAPEYTVITCGTCQGLPVTTKVNASAGDKAQYIFYVFRTTRVFAFGQWFAFWPDVRSLTWYGSPTGLADTTYNLSPWATNRWTPRNVEDIVGHFNLQNQQDTLWSDTAQRDLPEGIAGANMRNFDQNFFDDKNVPHGSEQLNLGGGGYTAYQYNAAMGRRGHYQFAAVFGNNAYFNAQLAAAGHVVNKGWNTNTITDDPQLPASYSRKGQYAHGLAWMGGSCTSCPGVPYYNGTPTPHLGYLKIIGTSNEPSGFFSPNAWKAPPMIGAEAHGIYDSVKAGDPNVLVFVAGYESYNLPSLKATIFYMRLLAGGRNIKADGFDIHAIHTLKRDSFLVVSNSNQQIGNYGVDPGYWDDWHRNNNAHNLVLRETGLVNIRFSITEDTYQTGLYIQYPRNVGETFSVSQLAAPGYTVGGVTLNRMNSQGVGAVKLEAFATASGIFQYYWYANVDESDASNNPNYDGIDQSVGKFFRPTSFSTPPTSKPADFYTSSRRKRMAKYYFSDTLTYTRGGLIVFMYRRSGTPDSLYFEYMTGDSAATQSFSLNGLNALTAQLNAPSGTSRQVIQSTASITSGSITLTADPLPRGVAVFSPIVIGPPAEGVKINKKRVI